MRGSNEELKRITRESLLEALIDIWETKPYERITVTELTQRAGVSRMAFYRNYASKDEIVAEHVRELYTDYTAQLEHEGRTLYIDYAVRFFSYIADNAEFMRRALAAGFDWALLESIEDYVGSEKVLRVSDVDMSRLKDPHLRRFAAGGYLNVLEKWLAEGMVETPQEIGELTASYIHTLLGPRESLAHPEPFNLYIK